MAEVRVAFITVPREEAKGLAKSIIEERLGACVNILPKIESVYWWKDKIEEAEESILIVKSTRQKVEALVHYVKETHSYEVPEIIILPISEGLPDYLDWVIEETGKR